MADHWWIHTSEWDRGWLGVVFLLDGILPWRHRSPVHPVGFFKPSIKYIKISLYWLVVYLPLWKIWVRQLGWWHSQYDGKNKSHVPVTTIQYMYIQTIPKHQSCINRKAPKKTPPQISQQQPFFIVFFNECPIASSPLSVGSTPGSPWSTWDSSWHQCRAALSCPNSTSPAPQPPQWCECSPPPACWRRSRRPDLGP